MGREDHLPVSTVPLASAGTGAAFTGRSARAVMFPRGVEYDVVHRIASKGSSTPGRRRDGSVFVRPANADLESYSAACELAALRARQHLLSGGPDRLRPPYIARVTFSFVRLKRGKGWPVRLDLDKCQRALADSWAKVGLISDHRDIVQWVAEKRYMDVSRSVLCAKGRPWGSVDVTSVALSHSPWVSPPRWEPVDGSQGRFWGEVAA